MEPREDDGTAADALSDGVRELYCALIKDGFEALRRGGMSDGGDSARRRYRDALEAARWFASDREDYPTAFVVVVHALGLELDAFRDRARREWVASGGAPADFVSHDPPPRAPAPAPARRRKPVTMPALALPPVELDEPAITVPSFELRDVRIPEDAPTSLRALLGRKIEKASARFPVTTVSEKPEDARPASAPDPVNAQPGDETPAAINEGVESVTVYLTRLDADVIEEAAIAVDLSPAAWLIRTALAWDPSRPIGADYHRPAPGHHKMKNTPLEVPLTVTERAALVRCIAASTFRVNGYRPNVNEYLREVAFCVLFPPTPESDALARPCPGVAHPASTRPVCMNLVRRPRALRCGECAAEQLRCGSVDARRAYNERAEDAAEDLDDESEETGALDADRSADIIAEWKDLEREILAKQKRVEKLKRQLAKLLEVA